MTTQTPLGAGSATRIAAPLLALTVGLGLVALDAPADAAPAKKPDLVVTTASVDRTAVAEGDTLVVRHVVHNRGTARAGATQTRFYLSLDPAVSRAERVRSRTNPRSAPQDVLLVGAKPVAALAAGRRVTVARASVKVPVGTAPGHYTVLACADDRGTVRERTETDNCTAAGQKVAVAVAPGSGTLRLQTFADAYSWPDDEQEAVDFLQLFCAGTRPAKTFTLAGALASTRAALTSAAGADALTLLKSSGLAGTPEKAQELAAGAVTQGSPGLALAALLEAHRLEQRNATHLVSAASLATSIGLPNEALAFLDRAQTLDLRRGAMGISQRAVALTVRGQALVMTGRAAAARPYFLAARSAEPLLSEADAGLANVEACDQQDAKAARFVRKARQRTTERTTPTEEPVRPESGVDVSLGEASTMRQLPIAETPRQAVVMEELYDGISAELLAEIGPRNDEREALEQHLRDTDELRTDAEIHRRSGLLGLVYGAGDDPEVAALAEAMDDLYADLLEVREGFWGGGTGEAPYTYGTLLEEAFASCAGMGSGCVTETMRATCGPELVGAHSEWRVLMGQLVDAGNAYFAALSTQMSGLAANLEDEEAHRVAQIAIEAVEAATYGGINQQGQLWTGQVRVHEDHCVTSPEVGDLPEEEGGSTADAGSCPDALKATSFVANLGPTTLKVTCEKVSQELAAEVLPLLSAFVEVTYDFRAGTVTVVAGSKGGGKLGGIVENGFKSGVYVTAGTDGSLKDVGWRVGPSTTVGTGPIEVEAYNGELDISFVSGMRSGT